MPTFVGQRSTERNAGLLLATELSDYRHLHTTGMHVVHILVNVAQLNVAEK